MKEELLKGLTKEQIEKAKECNSAEELKALAEKEGIELNDEQLEAVNGGGCGSTEKCPHCGSKDFQRITRYDKMGEVEMLKCNKCGKYF